MQVYLVHLPPLHLFMLVGVCLAEMLVYKLVVEVLGKLRYKFEEIFSTTVNNYLQIPSI